MVIDRTFWNGRRVFLTGHTGFKGAWLSLLLTSLGSKVFGYALPPEHENGLFNLAKVAADITHRIGDVRDLANLKANLTEADPEVVIHMAAQSLVRHSYLEPVETYATNVMGTVHLLEAVRDRRNVQAVVVVTSDKCYENSGGERAYRETDHLGGHDPYSNSKGCAELVTAAYRRSFFGDDAAIRVASARAGNVIGGGDWSRDRLVPDAIRAFSNSETLVIRSPGAIRPWQHVLDPLLAYLSLAERLVKDGASFAEGWNFGPGADSEVTVEQVVRRLAHLWGGGARWEVEQGRHPHEAAYLKLDCSKAHSRLGWQPIIDLPAALLMTVEWYRAFSQSADMRAFSLSQIDRFLRMDRVTRSSSAAAE